MSEPAATTTTGIYCKACGYDLRGSKGEGGAGRCPECGRAFSPADPKTFRPRPFAAEWKRALVRWATCGAILLVLLAGLWGWLYWGWKEEQAALARIPNVKVNASVPVILGGRPGEWLYHHRVPGSFVLERVGDAYLPAWAADADLLPLPELRYLEVLTVEGRISDAGLAALRRCPRLRWLTLCLSDVTDAGLVTLRDLPRLEGLALTEVTLGAAGVDSLEALPRLEYLNLIGTRITGDGLGRLDKLRMLKELNLMGAHVADAELAHLAGPPALRDLVLDDTDVTDASLVHLEKLPALCSLALRNTHVSDAGLVHLERLTGLKDLDLTGTNVTPAGAGRLKAALPGCTIVGP